MIQKAGARLSLELHSNDTSYNLGKPDWMLGKALSLSRWKPQEQVVQRHCGMSVLGVKTPLDTALKNLLSPNMLLPGRGDCSTSGGS